jgi:RNA polymerase sigma factor (sigma-70 family)
LQYTQNAEDAEEVTQDVFVSVYEKHLSFREDSELKTWIYRITINKSLDFLKSKKRQKRFGLFSALRIDDELPLDIPNFNHPGIELEKKESLKNLFRCINALPFNQRTAVFLLKIEHKSQAEAAEIMNISPKAVESLFQRAKANLKKLLKQTEGK